jgi:predicted phage gp36 major capsid-like protein
MNIAPKPPSDSAMACVRAFFDSASALTREEATALSREYRRRRQGNLHTDQDFLAAVTQGSWGPAHDGAARQIRAQARARAAVLVPWPRRGALAGALEAAALAVLSQADEGHPLPDALCARLTAPCQKVRVDLLARPRESVA